MNSGNFKHYAFISYSHKDEKWATWLQRKLENYRLPSIIRKEAPHLPKRMRPVFLDKTDIGVGILTEELHKELEDSQCLIVICSLNSARPNAEGKHFVNHETESFIQLGRTDRIIPFIIDGEVNASDPENECFCPALRNLEDKTLLGTSVLELGKERAFVKVVARILNLRFDTLWQRHLRRQRRTRLAITGMSFGLFIAAATAGYSIWTAQQETKRERTEKQQALTEKEKLWETQFEELQELVYTHYDEVSDVLGSWDTRVMLINLIESKVGKLKELGLPERPEFRREYAVALERIGTMKQTMGDLAAARQYYTDGLEIRRALVEQNPDSAEAKRDLSVSYNKLGNVAVSAGDLAAARQYYTDGLEISRALVEQNPDSAEAKRDLSLSLTNMGRVSELEKKWKDALDMYARVLEIDEESLVRSPSSKQASDDVEWDVAAIARVKAHLEEVEQ